MWTADPRACKLINDFYALFKFNQLPALYDSRARLSHSLYNRVGTSKEGQEFTFRQLMRKTQEESKSDKEITFDNQFADSEVLVQVNEWVLNSLARHLACHNVDFHAMLRHNLTSVTLKIDGDLGAIRLGVLHAAALMEVLYPVKHAIFLLNQI